MGPVSRGGETGPILNFPGVFSTRSLYRRPRTGLFSRNILHAPTRQIGMPPVAAAIPSSSHSTTAPPPPPHSGELPPATLPYKESVRLRVAHWMEDHFGRAYVPIAALGGAAVGGTLGAVTLGPVGGIAGALGGGFLGAALVFAG